MDANAELLNQFRDFLTTKGGEGTPLTTTPPVETTPPQSFDWLVEEETEIPSEPLPSPPSTSPPLPTGEETLKRYEPIINLIEKNPQLQKSWNKWYSEEVLGVKSETVPPTTISAQTPSTTTSTSDVEEIHRQWQEYYKQDPVSATAAIVQKLLETNQKALVDQVQSQIQPLGKFTANLMKTTFEQGFANDPVFKQAKPMFDFAVSQVPPEQIQQNPEILNVIYNIAIGQLYRQGQLSGKPTLTSMPGGKVVPPSVPGTSIPPVGGKSYEFTKEEQAMLRRYAGDISPEDYIKYGGE